MELDKLSSDYLLLQYSSCLQEEKALRVKKKEFEKAIADRYEQLHQQYKQGKFKMGEDE